MKQQFYGIYEQLFESFGREFSESEQQLAQDAKQIIDEAIDELRLHESVRPDARHFLHGIRNFGLSLFPIEYLCGR